jgi:hypothetical protein
MSIWTSVSEPVRALDGDQDDANYRAEGVPTVIVDVAITEYHGHIRLGLSNHAPGHEWSVDAILSPAAVGELRQALGAAAGGEDG